MKDGMIEAAGGREIIEGGYVAGSYVSNWKGKEMGV